MARFGFVALFTLAFGAAAICGGKTAEPVSDEEFLWLATAAAQDANLTIDDVPAAWESEPPDPDDEDDDDDEIPEGLSPECVELFESIDNSEAVAASETNPSAESDDFSDPDTRESVSTSVEVFRTVALATEAEDLIDDAFEMCNDEIGSVIEEEVNKDNAESGEEYRIENVQMLDYTKRDLGDWAREWGFSLTYDFAGLKVDSTLTFTYIRAGRMAGTFFHFQVDETDAELIDSMRELFADRMAKVDETLPK
jgi:hypothetical protein